MGGRLPWSPVGSVCVGGRWEGSSPPLSLWPQERYYVLYIRPSRIHRRKFDPKGNEVEPNFSATRKVNTGFLMSSYSRCPPSFLPQGLLSLGPFCVSRGSLGPSECLLSVAGLEAHVWPEGPLAGLLPALTFTQRIPRAPPQSSGPGWPPTSCRLLESGRVVPVPCMLGSRCLRAQAPFSCPNSHGMLRPFVTSFLFPVLTLQGRLCRLALGKKVSRLNERPSIRPSVGLLIHALSCLFIL